jgi:hypothetical protein
MTPWKQQHGSAEPVVREHAEETLVEVEPQPVAGWGLGEQNFLSPGAQDQLGQCGDSPGLSDRLGQKGH